MSIDKLPNASREEWAAALAKRYDKAWFDSTHAFVRLACAADALVKEIDEADWRDFSTGPAYHQVVAILKDMRQQK